jgi:serine protease
MTPHDRGRRKAAAPSAHRDQRTRSIGGGHRPALARRGVRAALTLVAGLATASTTMVGIAAPGLASPVPVDWVRSDQWQLTALHARSAWDKATGVGVTVAVLDSGVDAAHVDLTGQVLPGADFVDGTTDGRKDFVGHGTTVAGLIAGRSDDSSGVAGIAPRAKILPVRVLDRQNKYSDAANVAKALRWAVDHGAGVVNMSLGGAVRSPALADAISYAYRHDVVVVACTGNEIAGTSSEVWYPAREPGVVAVAGLSQGGDQPTLWSGTLTGPDTVLVAPATNLLGAKPGGYWRVQGTSFAAPLVSATAALIRSRWPQMDADNVINRLISTAHDLGPPGRDDQYGFGEVDPVAALTASGIPTVERNPLIPQSPAVRSALGLSEDASGAGGPVPDESSAAQWSAAPRSSETAQSPAPRAVAATQPDHRGEWGLAAGGVVILTGLVLLLRRSPG